MCCPRRMPRYPRYPLSGPAGCQVEFGTSPLACPVWALTVLRGLELLCAESPGAAQLRGSSLRGDLVRFWNKGAVQPGGCTKGAGTGPEPRGTVKPSPELRAKRLPPPGLQAGETWSLAPCLCGAMRAGK